MRKLLYTIATACLFCSLFGITGCSSDDDCTDATQRTVNVGIYTVATTDSTRRIVGDTVEFLHITDYETDSVIVNRESDVTSLSLPLRLTQDHTTMVFCYTDTTATLLTTVLRDTITFSHSNTPYFLTMDCNFAVKQELQSIDYTTHVLDSIVIVNPTANYNGTENIQIYY